ncbi:MAG: efflux RND transporter permease subunit [Hyphomicrobiales bacterium]|nr:efflux RND transporter permease subunit [Hyphomicrobiales bacterium]
MKNGNQGISGAIAAAFVRSQITALLLIAALLSGVFAVLVTPREEEPQINVTFADIFIAFPGASAREVENLVSTPAEQVLSEISGIKHVYSVSSPGTSVITVQFKVGLDRTEAIVRLYDKVFSNADWLPQNIGVGQPLIKPRSIDDIPIVAATLWSKDETQTAGELLKIAHTLEVELKRINGTRQINTIGGSREIVDVRIDPQKLAGRNLSLKNLRIALKTANASSQHTGIVNNNQQIPVRAGTFLVSAQEVGQLVVGVDDEKPVYLSDVAQVDLRAETPKSYVTFVPGMAAEVKKIDAAGRFPAVTLTIAKQPGTNAVDISNRVIERFEVLKNVVIPGSVEMTITRNYGATADAKAKKLITKLLFATGSVVILVIFTMGIRPAIVVGVAVIATLAVTLLASLAYGFTINRVSLFALIFSIGILVDDAIVVVENIHRHMELDSKRSIWELIPRAVDEVGGPTILATLTVIAALLPMAFVTGLMGPYMSPIPINASMGMLISLAIAFIITPWLAAKMLKSNGEHETPEQTGESKSYRFFAKLVGPFLSNRAKRYGLVLTLLVLVGGSVSAGVFQVVILKMLPFDNKSEFQVVVDMPEGTSLEATAGVLSNVGKVLDKVPEIVDYQIYAGTASPVGFNGLVRQYYLRRSAHLGDIQVNLVDAHDRDRKSHQIAIDLRQQLSDRFIGSPANIKVVEVPPGPPVLSPLVAEVYGLDYDAQIGAAKIIREIFEQTNDIVDIDDTIDAASRRIVVFVDRQRAATLGISQSAVSTAIATAIDGEDVNYLHTGGAKYPVPIRLQLADGEKADIKRVLALKLRARNGALVPLSQIVSVREEARETSVYHKDMMPVVYVLGDMAGPLDSPLYGMGEIYSKLASTSSTSGKIMPQFLFTQPPNPIENSIKWDGEWQITFETFRDMGIAYGVGMILIYFLIVAQFRSYLVPLIIMAPIPLTVIGVMPGHALLDAKFTATSMIGMIALAGIIVRNSILLVDFINQQIEEGTGIYVAVVNSSAVRAKPIILTGVAAMMGAFFIIDDPIFNGLAVSLIFGILVSTLLTLVVIPVLYYSYLKRQPQQS